MKNDVDWPILNHLPPGPITMAPRAEPFEKTAAPWWSIPCESGEKDHALQEGGCSAHQKQGRWTTPWGINVSFKCSPFFTGQLHLLLGLHLRGPRSFPQTLPIRSPSILRAWEGLVSEGERKDIGRTSRANYIYFTYMLQVSHVLGSLLCGIGVCKTRTSVL